MVPRSSTASTLLVARLWTPLVSSCVALQGDILAHTVPVILNIVATPSCEREYGTLHSIYPMVSFTISHFTVHQCMHRVYSLTIPQRWGRDATQGGQHTPPPRIDHTPHHRSGRHMPLLALAPSQSLYRLSAPFIDSLSPHDCRLALDSPESSPPPARTVAHVACKPGTLIINHHSIADKCRVGASSRTTAPHAHHHETRHEMVTDVPRVSVGVRAHSRNRSSRALASCTSQRAPSRPTARLRISARAAAWCFADGSVPGGLSSVDVMPVTPLRTPSLSPYAGTASSSGLRKSPRFIVTRFQPRRSAKAAVRSRLAGVSHAA